MISKRLPSLKWLPLKLVPGRLHAEAVARGFNRVLEHEPGAARLAGLNDKTIRLAVIDAGIELYLRIRDGKVTAARGPYSDVSIRGRAADFLQLASRQEDPDTLFFQRRLSLEGDTDTGLHLKNFLDNLELDWEIQLTHWIGRPLARATLGVARRLPRRPGFNLKAH
jgi:predicted lipid carrier protein YhbT